MALVTRICRCTRPWEAEASAPGHTRQTWLIAVVAALLAGCAADARPSDQALAVQGYWYHDGNHQGGASANASPQANYNATHGTWLWPPAERPGR
jgi:hypothetical protein